MLLDANFGYTHQVLGAEAPDLDDELSGSTDMNIPGTNGPDRLQGGMPCFQITNWANLGNPNTGNPFQFRDKQYVATVNLQWMRQRTRVPRRVRLPEPADQSLPAAGRRRSRPSRGTFQFNGNSTRLQNAPAPADTRFNRWADFLLGPAESRAGKVDQLLNPNSIYMKTYAAYVQDSGRSRAT